MTTTEQDVRNRPPRGSGADVDQEPLDAFHPAGGLRRDAAPMIVRGEGAYICDASGKRYLDGLVRAVRGPGRARPQGARRGGRASRPRELAFFPLWSYAHPKAIELADRLAAARPRRPEPGLLHHRRLRGRRVGLEAGQPYFKLIGKPMKHKVICRADRLPRHVDGRPVDHRAARRSRRTSSRSCPARSGCRTPTSTARRRSSATTDRRRSAAGPPTTSRRQILFEGPDTVAAVFLEPVQNAGGCFPPPPGYFQRVREICDPYDVLLVSDEVICAFGRLGDHVRLREVRLPARHHHLRQGHDLRLLPARRDDRLRPAGRAVPATATTAFAARLHLRRAPGVGRGRRWPTSTSSSARTSTGTCCDNEAAFRSTLEKLLRPADRRRRPRRRLLLRHRAGQGQGDQGDLQRRRVRARCCAASCPRPCSRPASTAAPTTAATRSSSSPRR